MEILLGYGVLYIDGVAVGLTKGGSQFSTDEEFKAVEADGDRGNVKGRIYKTKSIPKLKLSKMQGILTDFPKLHPGVTTASITGSFSGVVFTGTGTAISASIPMNAMAPGDYHNVCWKGWTMDGKLVFIEVQNVLNLKGIDWALKDKDEVVDAVELTGNYIEGSTAEPWRLMIQQ